MSSKQRSGPRTRYQIIKDSWGNRLNFQLSYGLKMTPEDIEEGNAILDALEEQEKEDWKEANQNK
ncbi:hypothetical protein D9758_005149 [Tetrapyrgos nigripes]|uniref:Uncharacterized protein n=1 Tax=Tetrapyrgos nigripes TaxID=182062 RepID=A0A8H5GWY7_9AGAR|nr:hypothetical protein D9758_005149 [Tetrapyrgos nigripes]